MIATELNSVVELADAAKSYVGEVAGLGTSVAFALCGLAFASAGRRVGALAVNQLRIYAAVVIMGSFIMATSGDLWPVPVFSEQSVYLLLSGFIGLTLGDLALFQSFAMIGPRLGTLVMAMAPAMVALMAWPILGEHLDAVAVVGMTVTLVGVVWVLSESRDAAAWKPAVKDVSYMLAIGYALIGALGQAGGLILVKMAKAAGEEIASVQMTFMRLVAGALSVFVLTVASGKTGVVMKALRDRRALWLIGLGTVVGPVLGVWLSLVAVLRSESIGVASTLSSLSAIVMLPIAWIAYGARPSGRAIVGTTAAVVGSVFLFY